MARPQEPHDALTHGLRGVAAADEGLGASAEVRNRLLAETRLVRSRRRRTVLTTYTGGAVLMLAVSAAVWSVRDPAAGAPPADAVAADDTQTQATEFFPLFYSRVPTAAVHVVRLEVSREALATFGVEAPGADASPTVVADVVVGSDGLARAIRFVNP